MDVALVLTHRCNFACGYCYAGEHHKTDMDPAVLERALDLLFADGCETAQLSFFGGEPFLAFGAMERATKLAEERAAREGKRLLLQCTTNGSLITDEHVRFVLEHGMRVTVSIDGVPEAHDANRPCAGGRASFGQAYAGLRRLLDAGAACDAMMVITPQTAQHTYLSVSFLWSEGVRVVRANIALDAPWSREDRAELREQLVSIGWELLARRLCGEEGTFEPFEREIRARTSGGTAAAPPRSRVVVATSGNLYPCAPMVGEDREAEAGVRLGHLDDGVEHIAARVSCDGVRCDKGGGCECAAYLETGDRKKPGAMGRWYGAVCQQIGATVAEALASHAAQMKKPKRTRRRVLAGIAAVIGAAVAAPVAMHFLGDGAEPALKPCQLRVRFDDTVIAGDISPPEPPMALGEMAAPPPPPPPPPPEHETIIDGEIFPY